MSTSPAREFHGRDAELALIRAELEPPRRRRRRSGGRRRGRRGHGQEPPACRGRGDRSQPRHQSRAQRRRSERDDCRAYDAPGGPLRRNRTAARPRRAQHSSRTARATVLVAARPAATARTGSPRGAAPDLDRRRPLGRQWNDRGASHPADATDGIADRLGDRASPAARGDTARARARTVEAGGGAPDHARPTR